MRYTAIGGEVLEAEPSSTFDAGAPFPDVNPVYVVVGSPRDMGFQYGRQGKDIIARNACAARAGAMREFETWEGVLAALQPHTEAVAAMSPDSIEVWHGIAEGSGLLYDEIRLLNSLFKLALCSTISCWGSATEGGAVIAGATGDSAWLTYAGCVLIAYPADGNSFIVSVPAAGLWHGIRSMNAKGVVMMLSGGQGEREVDRTPGYEPAGAYLETIQHSSTAAEAKERFIGFRGLGPVNTHILDAGGDAYVVESTAAVIAVRRPGDFGERDYLVATNGYLTDDLQPAMFAGEMNGGWIDWWYRYVTEEKLINSSYGELTAGSLMRILGCHDYWDGKEWHCDVLSLEPALDPLGRWTPGVRDAHYSPAQREIFLPGELTAYIMTGNDDPLFSPAADTTGEYCRLVLADRPNDVAAHAVEDAQRQIWQAAVALHKAAQPFETRVARLNAAKRALAEGKNYQIQAVLARDVDWNALFLGRALTCFCKAQCYAQQAQRLMSTPGVAPPTAGSPEH